VTACERERDREELHGNKTKLVQSRCCAEDGLPDTYSAPQHMRRMSGTCSTHGDKRNAYNILKRKSEGNTQLGRPKVRWENNIKMDFE
jgi:hypothetical protein